MQQDYSHITSKSLMGFSVLFAIYVAAAVTAGIHGAKLVSIGPFVFDAGLITISLTFLCTDIVSEVYGKAYAKKIVLGGMTGIVATIIFTRIALLMPGAAEWEFAHEYDTILGAGSRVLLAALAAYVGGQFLDITVFNWVRQATRGKYLWLRNNISTLAGGFADTVLFSTIAFYGVYEVLPIIMSAYAIRVFISLADTPLVYAGVYLFYRRFPELQK